MTKRDCPNCGNKGKVKHAYILGFPKCGSTSLRTYLRKIHPGAEVVSFPSNRSLYHDDFHLVNDGKCMEEGTVNYIIMQIPGQKVHNKREILNVSNS